MDNEEKKPGVTAIVIGIVALACCVCLLIAGIAGYGYYTLQQSDPFSNIPINIDSGGSPTAVPEMTRPPVDATTTETLETLKASIVPTRDLRSLSCRLNGVCNVPDVIATSAAPRNVGEKDNFWVINNETAQNFEVTATLRYITPHVYFWVEDGVTADDGEIKALVDDFENKMYPTNREFFGSEWIPGIDGDEHIYILYARGLGSTVAGYFSSADSVHPLLQEYSNGHEMFIFNADNTEMTGYAYTVLAHEFQHMIHWKNDVNETSWINEGASELAVLLNGYYYGGADYLFISNPDFQLNDWSSPDSPDFSAHYGASFLFMAYFLDRFGEEATQALVKDPANGLDSVEDVLRQIDAVDPVTGAPISADDFFMDWVITNFLLDKSVGDGRYTYTLYTSPTRASATETIYNCPQAPMTRDVHQYGADYIEIACEGNYTLTFTGSTITGLLPADPYSGEYAFWSNKGDESDMTLTREFDFTDVTGNIELSYQTWYDIEQDWDYLYVLASEDGETWEFLSTPSGTGTDPSGNSYGWGYTGSTGDWIEEKVDLSEYAGKKVFIRFEYVTDAAVNGEGLLLDDVKVEAAGYSSDFEADDGGWQAEGFVRVQNVLPQTFRLALIETDGSKVTMIPVNADQTAEVKISLQSGEKAYLVVAGTTRFTRALGAYQIEIK